MECRCQSEQGFSAAHGGQKETTDIIYFPVLYPFLEVIFVGSNHLPFVTSYLQA